MSRRRHLFPNGMLWVGYRPQVEILEPRLPPGIAGLDALIASSMFMSTTLDAQQAFANADHASVYELSETHVASVAQRGTPPAASESRTRTVIGEAEQPRAPVREDWASRQSNSPVRLPHRSTYASVAVAIAAATPGPRRVVAGEATRADAPAMFSNLNDGARAPLRESAPEANREGIVNQFGRTSLSFEPNLGQTDSEVDFLARGASYALFLTPTEAVLNVQQRSDAFKSHPEAAAGVAIHMQVVGANPEAAATALSPLAGKVNYFLGRDPSQWRTDIPTFGRVEYQDVYPGIDLAYYGNQQQLEYDFVVSPGADPSAITLNFAGVDGIEINPRGDLELHTPVGDVVHQKPFTYQEVDGVRHEIASRYVLDGRRISFEVGAYDENQPLVIDPLVLSYSTFLGGDNALGIGVDAARNAYVAGYTGLLSFPTTPGALQEDYAGGFTDAFIMKLNPTGSGLVYATYLGGGNDQSGYGEDKAFALAVDLAGNVYVAGTTTCTDFPTTQDAFDITFSGGLYDAFVTKLNPQGNDLIYSSYLGGVGNERANGIAFNTAGEAFVTGSTNSFNFPTTPGAFDTTYNGESFNGNFFTGDAFMTRIAADGSALTYSTFIGGSKNESGRGIALDRNSNASITGETDSPNLPTTAGVFQPNYAGGANGGTLDAFVAKLMPNGTDLVYASYLGGNSTNFYGEDFGYGIASDRIGNVYVAGTTQSKNFPTTPGAFDTVHDGSTDDGFVTKITPNGQTLIYSTYLGGSSGDRAFAIAIDRNGSAYLTGQTSSSNFPTTPGVFQPTFGGWIDVFVTKLLPSGAALGYSSFLGTSGSNLEAGYAITVDRSGNAYVTGETESNAFPTTPGAFDTTHNPGTNDTFLAKVVET